MIWDICASEQYLKELGWRAWDIVPVVETVTGSLVAPENALYIGELSTVNVGVDTTAKRFEYNRGRIPAYVEEGVQGGLKFFVGSLVGAQKFCYNMRTNWVRPFDGAPLLRYDTPVIHPDIVGTSDNLLTRTGGDNCSFGGIFIKKGWCDKFGVHLEGSGSITSYDTPMRPLKPYSTWGGQTSHGVEDHGEYWYIWYHIYIHESLTPTSFNWYWVYGTDTTWSDEAMGFFGETADVFEQNQNISRLSIVETNVSFNTSTVSVAPVVGQSINGSGEFVGYLAKRLE